MQNYFLLLLVVTGMLASARECRAEETDASRKATALAHMKQLATAMGYLQADCGELPTDQQGLGSLLADPGFKGWNGPYIQGALPLDPWKSSYRYRLTKDYYELRSAGPDQKFDTADDITPSKPKK